MEDKIVFKDKDMLVMKLLHYFITEKGYTPIILHGVQNEIWLENMEGPYKIVRIMTGYIHNEDQYNFDMFKTKKIIQKIKLKTMTWKIKALSIFTDVNDIVNISNDPDISCVTVKSENEIQNINNVTSVFTDIDNKLVVSDNTVELFTRITNDISENNKKRAIETEEIFKTKKPIVTYSLIFINVIIFILMYIFGKGSEDIETLINFGAMAKIYVNAGDYFRLFTAGFLHIGILHLLFNMYALYVIGTQVENYFGHIKYLIIYSLSIIFGSLISFMFIDSSTISAGASGAIFGLLGALLYFGYYFRAYLGNVLTKQIMPVILINLFIGFSVSGIDTWAHIGGLIGGILAASAVGIKYKTTKFERTNGIIVTVLALIFLIYYAFMR